ASQTRKVPFQQRCCVDHSSRPAAGTLSVQPVAQQPQSLAKQIVIVCLPPRVAGDASLSRQERRRICSPIVHPKHYYASNRGQNVFGMLVCLPPFLQILHPARKSAAEPVPQSLESLRSNGRSHTDQSETGCLCLVLQRGGDFGSAVHRHDWGRLMGSVHAC